MMSVKHISVSEKDLEKKKVLKLSQKVHFKTPQKME